MTNAYTEAELYCAAFNWPLGSEVDWLLDEARRVMGRQPTSVLEPMCGNARYGPAFADRGVRYHGFDISPDMLALVPRREDVTTSCADARCFDVARRPFDLGWCPINSIRHLASHDDLTSHLRCMRSHLARDGVYVLESDMVRWDGPWREAPEEQANWTLPQPDGSEVRGRWWLERCDKTTRRIVERARFERIVEGDSVAIVESRYEMLMLSTDDWRQAAMASGFHIDQVWAHGSGDQREVVPFSGDLENTGVNYYVFLK